MNILSLLSFAVFLTALFLAIYVILLDRRSSLNIVYFFMAFFFSFWAFGYTFLYPAQTVEKAWFWYRFSSLGWCTIPSLFLIFSLDISGHKDILNKWWLVTLIVLIPVVLLVRSFTGVLYLKDFVIDPAVGYILEVPAYNSPWFYLYIAYMMGFLSVSYFVLWRWKKRAKNNKHKKQAALLVSGGLAAFVISYLFNVVLLLAGVKNLPVIGHFGILVFVIASAYAIMKYKMMTITPKLAIDSIINDMQDILILLEPDGSILKVNPAAEKLLGYSESRLIGKPLDDLLKEKRIIYNVLAGAKLKDIFPHNLEFHFVRKNKTLLPVHLSCSIIYDVAQDLVGFTILAHDISFIREIENERNKLRSRNEMIESELRMAHNIQKQLIPQESPLPNIATYYKPMDKLGGDFFDFVPFRSKNKIGIFVSDVSGHGVPAALITSMIKSLIIQSRKEKEDPAQFLDYLNRAMQNQTGGNFVTAFYCIIEFRTLKMTYANAGHVLPYVVCRDSIDQIPAEKRGMPLAILTSEELESLGKFYRNQTVQMPANCKLLLFTDGVTETVNIREESVQFDESELPNLLQHIRKLPAGMTVSTIEQILRNFRGSDDYEDDVCMICIDFS